MPVFHRLMSVAAAGSVVGLLSAANSRRRSEVQAFESKNQQVAIPVILNSALGTATVGQSAVPPESLSGNSGQPKNITPPEKAQKVFAGRKRPDLPDITLDAVKAHDGSWVPDKPKSTTADGKAIDAEALKDTEEEVEAAINEEEDGRDVPDSERIFVTYKHGVYDVTNFLNMHPGGRKRLLLAAGGSIEKYWAQFTLHDDDAVRTMLESMRIGNLAGYSEEDARRAAEALQQKEDQRWVNEPKRDEGLAVMTMRPFNAEAPAEAFASFLTPNNLYFVRSHMPVPLIDEKVIKDDAERSPFCLQVEGKGLISHCFTLDELHSLFKPHTVANTMQCGGNRRADMAPVAASLGRAPTKGLQWTNGGISTAEWKGFLLKDILDYCKAPAVSESPSAATHEVSLEGAMPLAPVKHVHFQGADTDAAGHFSVSVPYAMALADDRQAIVAYEMNNAPIPRDHGYPLRAIVPGTVGVRNCKWLNKVSVVEGKEAQTVWQQNDYKNFPSYSEKPDPSLPSVYAMPVQSALTEAKYATKAAVPGEGVDSKEVIEVQGYAYTGSGSGIQRVEVSLDGGASFSQTALLYKGNHSKVVRPVAESVGAPTGMTNVSSDASFSPESGRGKDWTWSLFSASLDLSKSKCKPTEVNASKQNGELKTSTGGGSCCWSVCSRAVANDNAAQPQYGSYNFRGLLYNGYSCKEVCTQ